MRATCLLLAVIAGFGLTRVSLAEEACVAVSNGVMCGVVVSPDQPLRRPSSSPPPEGQPQEGSQTGNDRPDAGAVKSKDDRRQHRSAHHCGRRGERNDECLHDRNRERFGRLDERRNAEEFRNRHFHELLRLQGRSCGCEYSR
jgi:hypothetical protein